MRILLFLLALSSLSACSTENELVGKWKTPAGETMLTFADDGTFHTTAPGGEVVGRYQTAENGLVEMKFDGVSEQFATEVSGDQLTFCQENYGCERFRRMK